MHFLLGLITDLGDAALLLPCTIVLLAYLLASKSRRLAVAWVSALVLCAGLTVLAKIACYACGAQQLAGLEVLSPSGHTSVLCFERAYAFDRV